NTFLTFLFELTGIIRIHAAGHCQDDMAGYLRSFDIQITLVILVRWHLYEVSRVGASVSTWLPASLAGQGARIRALIQEALDTDEADLTGAAPYSLVVIETLCFTVVPPTCTVSGQSPGVTAGTCTLN